MTDAFMSRVQGSTDRVFFPFLGNDNFFTRGIKVNKIMFTIPGTNFSIHWYGFFIAMALLIALLYAERNYKKHGINPDKALSAVICGGILAIVCARLYYVIFSWSDYVVDGKIDWAGIVNTRNGGLAIYGGVIGGFIGAAIVCRITKIRMLALFDIASVGFLIGHTLGRLGNFTNQEAYGSLTSAPWAMTSSKIMRELAEQYPKAATNDLLAHPCFLYESLWCLLGLILLLIYKKHRKFDGEMFFMYLGWYGAGRAVIEGFRTDSLYIGHSSIRVSQLLAFILFVASVITIIIVRVKIKKNGNYKFFYETDISKQQLAEYQASIDKKKKKTPKDLTEEIDNAFEPDTDASYSNDEDAEDMDDIVDDAFNDEEKESSEESVVSEDDTKDVKNDIDKTGTTDMTDENNVTDDNISKEDKNE